MRRLFTFQRTIIAVATFAVIASACGRAVRHVPMPIPELPGTLDMKISLRGQPAVAPPLVVLLDDGPPVDVTFSHPQRHTIGQLESILLREGYGVWRPFRDLWTYGDLTVYCPDRLTSWTLLGLRTARGMPQIDPERIVVLGFGQGGMIGVLATRRSGTLVHAVAMVGTPARALDIVLTSPALRDSITRSRLLDTFSELWAGSYPDTAIVLGGAAQCWRSWLHVSKNLTQTIAAISQPTLAVQGTADTLTPMLDLERLRRVLANRPQSRAVAAVGVKHDLRDQHPDPKQDPGQISPRLVAPLMEWLREVAPVP